MKKWKRVLLLFTMTLMLTLSLSVTAFAAGEDMFEVAYDEFSDPRVEAKYKNDRELRNKALELRANWGLAGLTDEQYNLLSQAERDGEI